MNEDLKNSNQPSVIVIGAGIGGLSAAAYLAKAGFSVTVIEQNKWVGGRLHTYSEKGYTFDLGPSWYWMPEVFDAFFKNFGYKTKDFYQLKRLNPSYRVFFEDEVIDLPASTTELISLFERIEAGAGEKLRKLIIDTQAAYELSINRFIPISFSSVSSFLNITFISKFLKLLFSPTGAGTVAAYYRSLFKNPKILKILEFPIFFLGAASNSVPAVYALMNYVDFVGGTWYPQGGFVRVAESMAQVAKELGVKIQLQERVTHINDHHVVTDKGTYTSDYIVANADYAAVENQLLEKKHCSYSPEYFDRKKLAPSAFLLYLGLNKKIDKVLHHTLFFQHDWESHNTALFKQPAWPKKPLYYVSCASQTDVKVAPKNGETLTILVPIASGLEDTPKTRKLLSDWVLSDLEKTLNQEIKSAIKVKKTYSLSDFESDYAAYKGNAYGLAHTALQTAIFRPTMRSKKLSKLFYCGHWTVPGIGVPLVAISGKVVAEEILKEYAKR